MKIASRNKKLATKQLTSWKPYTFPAGFILVIDTREQHPLFKRTKGLISTVDTLQHGDYSIKGFEDKFAVERKQTSDFFSYIGSERKRTKSKLENLKHLDFASLVIEATEDDLYAPQMFSKLTREHVRGFFASLNIRYGVHLYCSRSRSAIERYILDRAIKYYNVIRGA